MNYTEVNVKIHPVEIGRDIMVAELAEIGYESFVETEKGIQAYIQSVDFHEKQLKTLPILRNKEFTVEFQITQIEEQNWNETWEKNFEPILVNNRCYVKAPFHPAIHAMEFSIEIEPKMSFGTGHHETTHLMIEKLLELDLTNKAVLDMGCGTGVLAILSVMKGAAPVMAIDIDEWAYQNTIENVTRNNTHLIQVLKGGAELLTSNQFNIVIANINRNILLNDLNKYAESLISGGEMLLSGFFSSDKEALSYEAQKYGMTIVDEQSKNDWTLLHLKKK